MAKWSKIKLMNVVKRCHLCRIFAPPGFDLLRNLPLHSRRGRPFSSGILKHMHFIKACFAHKLLCSQKLFRGFSREPHNRQNTPEPLSRYRTAVISSALTALFLMSGGESEAVNWRIFSIHSFENRIAAALQGKMKMRAKPGAAEQ